MSWHPEGSGRFPEACPEAYASIPVSSQFRKVSERFPEACFNFVCLAAVPEGSGRFPEACTEACLKTSLYRIPEASRRFPEGRREVV